jgi:hypothetical protein
MEASDPAKLICDFDRSYGVITKKLPVKPPQTRSRARTQPAAEPLRTVALRIAQQQLAPTVEKT